MKKMIKLLGLFVFLLLLINACSQYDEGPALSLYSKGKRVQGTWYFSRVLYNEVDSTEHYTQGRIEFLLGDSPEKDWGLYTWLVKPYSSAQDPDRVKLGGWRFTADKDSLQMVIVAKKQTDYDTLNWRIDRLAYNEWWMERQLNDTTKLRWELWKWVY